ncbi:hypothetical protein AQUCO_01700601v1 [Aquilegia coerulea]|nr:hypothetical protein AQUCO_01700601v1 [Aquilegia coerulea]
MAVCQIMANIIDMNRGDGRLNLKETELCLGLPGGGGGGGGTEGETTKSSMKRGYSETITDLKLNLESKDQFEMTSTEKTKNLLKEKKLQTCTNDPARPPAAKAQVIGWPPVRPFRKNIAAVQKKSTEEEKVSFGASFVKVSMDGAPYLRKVDLKMYKSYQELSAALGKMFGSFTIGNCGSHGMKDFMNESKLMDLLSGSEYMPTYEDKDGDWMLVGDVPWE